MNYWADGLILPRTRVFQATKLRVEKLQILISSSTLTRLGQPLYVDLEAVTRWIRYVVCLKLFTN